MPRPGHIYRQFTTAEGSRVILRSVKINDADSLLYFINSLVREKGRDQDSMLYGGFDRKVSRKKESEWLAGTLEAIKRGEVINVVAEIEGKIIANGEVTRGRYDDTRHHGQLGLTMIGRYRGHGIGRKMIETLVKQSRRAGLRSLEVEFLAQNRAARRAYEREGFRRAGLIPRKIFRNGKYLDGLIMTRKL